MSRKNYTHNSQKRGKVETFKGKGEKVEEYLTSFSKRAIKNFSKEYTYNFKIH